MSEYDIIEYTDDMQGRVHEFFSEVFPESNKDFELNGRHSVFADINRNFIGFWCMLDGEKIIGTVALKKLNDKECELKGLYLFKKYHGNKLGYRLTKTAVDFAREQGFSLVKLDTMSAYERALRLYEKMGFQRCERYNSNERANIFMELYLER
jgi:ribosomal protein S18 acetylase RimI-like enzyme